MSVSLSKSLFPEQLRLDGQHLVLFEDNQENLPVGIQDLRHAIKLCLESILDLAEAIRLHLERSLTKHDLAHSEDFISPSSTSLLKLHGKVTELWSFLLKRLDHVLVHVPTALRIKSMKTKFELTQYYENLFKWMNNHIMTRSGLTSPFPADRNCLKQKTLLSPLSSLDTYHLSSPSNDWYQQRAMDAWTALFRILFEPIYKWSKESDHLPYQILSRSDLVLDKAAVLPSTSHSSIDIRMPNDEKKNESSLRERKFPSALFSGARRQVKSAFLSPESPILKKQEQENAVVGSILISLPSKIPAFQSKDDMDLIREPGDGDRLIKPQSELISPASTSDIVPGGSNSFLYSGTLQSIVTIKQQLLDSGRESKDDRERRQDILHPSNSLVSERSKQWEGIPIYCYWNAMTIILVIYVDMFKRKENESSPSPSHSLPFSDIEEKVQEESGMNVRRNLSVTPPLQQQNIEEGMKSTESHLSVHSSFPQTVLFNIPSTVLFNNISSCQRHSATWLASLFPAKSSPGSVSTDLVERLARRLSNWVDSQMDGLIPEIISQLDHAAKRYLRKDERKSISSFSSYQMDAMSSTSKDNDERLNDQEDQHILAVLILLPLNGLFDPILKVIPKLDSQVQNHLYSVSRKGKDELMVVGQLVQPLNRQELKVKSQVVSRRHMDIVHLDYPDDDAGNDNEWTGNFILRNYADHGSTFLNGHRIQPFMSTSSNSEATTDPGQFDGIKIKSGDILQLGTDFGRTKERPVVSDQMTAPQGIIFTASLPLQELRRWKNLLDALRSLYVKHPELAELENENENDDHENVRNKTKRKKGKMKDGSESKNRIRSFSSSLVSNEDLNGDIRKAKDELDNLKSYLVSKLLVWEDGTDHISRQSNDVNHTKKRLISLKAVDHNKLLEQGLAIDIAGRRYSHEGLNKLLKQAAVDARTERAWLKQELGMKTTQSVETKTDGVNEKRSSGLIHEMKRSLGQTLVGSAFLQASQKFIPSAKVKKAVDQNVLSENSESKETEPTDPIVSQNETRVTTAENNAMSRLDLLLLTSWHEQYSGDANEKKGKGRPSSSLDGDVKKLLSSVAIKRTLMMPRRTNRKKKLLVPAPSKNKKGTSQLVSVIGTHDKISAQIWSMGQCHLSLSSISSIPFTSPLNFAPGSFSDANTSASLSRTKQSMAIQYSELLQYWQGGLKWNGGRLIFERPAKVDFLPAHMHGSKAALRYLNRGKDDWRPIYYDVQVTESYALSDEQILAILHNISSENEMNRTCSEKSGKGWMIIWSIKVDSMEVGYLHTVFQLIPDSNEEKDVNDSNLSGYDLLYWSYGPVKDNSGPCDASSFQLMLWKPASLSRILKEISMEITSSSYVVLCPSGWSIARLATYLSRTSLDTEEAILDRNVFIIGKTGPVHVNVKPSSRFRSLVQSRPIKHHVRLHNPTTLLMSTMPEPTDVDRDPETTSTKESWLPSLCQYFGDEIKVREQVSEVQKRLASFLKVSVHQSNVESGQEEFLEWKDWRTMTWIASCLSDLMGQSFLPFLTLRREHDIPNSKPSGKETGHVIESDNEKQNANDPVSQSHPLSSSIEPSFHTAPSGDGLKTEWSPDGIVPPEGDELKKRRKSLVQKLKIIPKLMTLKTPVSPVTLQTKSERSASSKKRFSVLSGSGSERLEKSASEKPSMSGEIKEKENSSEETDLSASDKVLDEKDYQDHNITDKNDLVPVPKRPEPENDSTQSLPELIPDTSSIQNAQMFDALALTIEGLNVPEDIIRRGRTRHRRERPPANRVLAS